MLFYATVVNKELNILKLHALYMLCLLAYKMISIWKWSDLSTDWKLVTSFALIMVGTVSIKSNCSHLVLCQLANDALVRSLNLFYKSIKCIFLTGNALKCDNVIFLLPTKTWRVPRYESFPLRFISLSCLIHI